MIPSACSGGDSDTVEIGPALSVLAHTASRGGSEVVSIGLPWGLGKYGDHGGRFLKGDFFPPGEAAAGHDEGDSGVVWVGSCNEEVGRGRGKRVDKLGVACRWE
jgi:hypothetical protein